MHLDKKRRKISKVMWYKCKYFKCIHSHLWKISKRSEKFQWWKILYQFCYWSCWMRTNYQIFLSLLFTLFKSMFCHQFVLETLFSSMIMKLKLKANECFYVHIKKIWLNFLRLILCWQVIAEGNHVINNKKIEAKKAKAKSGKIFVGGLTPEMKDEDIKSHFAQFGNVSLPPCGCKILSSCLVYFCLIECLIFFFFSPSCLFFICLDNLLEPCLLNLIINWWKNPCLPVLLTLPSVCTLFSCLFFT